MEQGSVNGVTSISQLPSSNQIANSIENIPQNANMMNASSMNNIVISKNESINEANTQLQPTMQNPHIQQEQQQIQIMESQNVQIPQGQNNYNELINQLQKASSQGATGLPSRDIPSNPSQVNNDVEIKPNYVPPPPSHEDYINNMQTPEYLIHENNKRQKNMDSLELIYGEFQLPLLVCILYFLFQLPFFKKNVKKSLPSLFGDDGNPNLYGYFFNSALFGILFYILLQFINRLNEHVN
tara:strand:- start:190 stop:909 length:720 start_codon:yes stop_codon:yes gene_type:complete